MKQHTDLWDVLQEARGHSWDYAQAIYAKWGFTPQAAKKVDTVSEIMEIEFLRRSGLTSEEAREVWETLQGRRYLWP